MKDLVVLVADNQARAAIDALLTTRRAALGLRDVGFDIVVHSKRDPGCYQTSHDLLRSQVGRYARCLVVFDYEGCGRDHRATPAGVADQLMARLTANGWHDTDACVVVIDPELEAWVWSGSTHVARMVAGVETTEELLQLLEGGGFMAHGATKPARPKEAMEYVLRLANKPHSASVFAELAKVVSLADCKDPAFGKLAAQLQTWFGVHGLPT